MPTNKTFSQDNTTQSGTGSSPADRPDQDMSAKDKSGQDMSAKDVAGKAGDMAQDAVKQASDVARKQGDEAKSAVADELSSVSSALRKAADEMRSGSPQERTFGQIAESLADASDALRDKDLGTMVGDVSRFARANPMVFLGGAALIGFAATRFAKASADGEGTTPGGSTTYRGGF